MERSNAGLAKRAARITLTGNVLLSAFKLFAGYFAHSAAMVSDAVHSLSDVLADVIVLAGIKLSNRASDKEHPYGHERIECVAGVLLAFILFSVGALIGWGGIQKIFAGNSDALPVPGALALVAAAVSILVKEGMYWYTLAVAKKVNSVALRASAWHHRSDALSSIGSFAGILGARLGFPILDAVACVVICAFILKVAVSIFKEAVDKMIDTACDDALVDEIRALALAQASVVGIDQIKTRLFGDKIYVDLSIVTYGDMSLHEAHDVAQHVHDAIESRFPNVKHCMIHVNPAAREAECADGD